ncbi:Peptidase M28 [Candidatus Sulfopaludibacter sp. SbA3]|nr:Peptidase M28 [Candidatus Sulfopaludibacter sp. SbA3]
MERMMKCKLALACGAFAAVAAVAQTTPVLQQIASRLTADALKADVSFLASDALQGRGTPSPGLDIAAEFIAAQFRRAGLEPAGDDGYFQTAPFAQVAPSLDGLQLSLSAGGQTITADKASLSIQEAAALDLKNAAAFKVSMGDPASLDSLTLEQVQGKVLLVDLPDAPAGPAVPGGGRGAAMALRRLPAAAAKLRPSLLVMLRSAAGPAGGRAQRLREAMPTEGAAMPILVVSDAAIRNALAAAKPGPLEATVSAHIAAPTVEQVKLRNVVGILRGSDPALKETYVMLTAHYDHLGVRGSGPGDHIYNGANDDASGTASVIEIAAGLAALPSRPKRSIVFIALFGEELGDLGSGYYARHPIFPLARTVADVNLEQLGRTDESNVGQKLSQFNLTGFDFTNIAGVFRKAGEQTGVQVVKDEKNSDPFFTRSDNAAFANAGVPSTTLSVTYVFSDYHAVGDEWPKLDYDNMAKVDRTIALAALDIATSIETPQWDANNPKTAAFVKAREASK